jgi:hypothetical protein
LTRANYCWFALTANSNLQPISARLKTYDANLVALPEERADEICRMLTEMKFRERTEARRRVLQKLETY